jgi:hypothetical protein
MPTIPLTPPELLFSAQVLRPYSGFVERPVVSEDVVLLAGDDASVAALDGATGRQIFLLSLPLESTEGYAGPPLPLGEGSSLVPVYQKDAWLRVHRVGPDGQIEAMDEPGVEEEARGGDARIVAHDGSCRLFLMPLARGVADDYLVSWIYRQVRYHRTECRAFGKGLRWACEEALLATTGDVALGVTAPVRGTDNRGMLIARDKRSGSELWSMPARHRTVAGASGHVFFVLDRSARMAEEAARKIACDEEMLEVLAEEPALMGVAFEQLERSLLAKRPVRAPSRIMALDARTGAPLWEAELPGDVVSFGGPGGGMLAAVSVEGTVARLHRLDARSGAHLGHSSLGTGWRTSPVDPWAQVRSFEVWSNEMPAVVAVDAEAIVWSSPEELFAERLRAPFDKLWQWQLPAPCRGFRPRVLDRVLNEPSISVGEGRVYLRDGWSLWGIGARG